MGAELALGLTWLLTNACELDLVPVGTGDLGLMGEAARGLTPVLSPTLFEVLALREWAALIVFAALEADIVACPLALRHDLRSLVHF